jgi:hypothetical protein
MGLPSCRQVTGRAVGLVSGLILIWFQGVLASRARAASVQFLEAKVSATILASTPAVNVVEYLPPVLVQAGVVLIHMGQGVWMQQGSVGPGVLPQESMTQLVTPEVARMVESATNSNVNVAETTGVAGVAITSHAGRDGRRADQLRVLVEFN